MADEQQLARMARRAHEAGDTEAVKRLLRAIKAMQAQQQTEPQAAPKTMEEPVSYTHLRAHETN